MSVQHIPASIVLSLIRVSVLGVNTAVVLDVLEGEVHKTSLTSVVAVAGGAVDQVLFTAKYKKIRMTNDKKFSRSS
jgi:hypothetical protein